MITARTFTAIAAGLWLAACQAEEAVVVETPKPPVQQAPAMSQSLRYTETVMAPDACYLIDDAQTRVERGTTLAVQRLLRREAGICAQVLTPLEVTGTVDDIGGFSTVVLEIVNVNGDVTQSFPLR